ncbi:hypothetical protein [Dactylosporangium sp. CA-139066]|uniref:hypothetical protein n=1 Tax=Dactylosporangium sp. CA-139066 TaxID=3239930 RepID=UPI003D917E21
MTAQGGPRTGVVLAVVGALLAACLIGGSAAAYVIERGLPGVLPTDLSHRQPRDVCPLLEVGQFRKDGLGELLTSHDYKSNGCDYVLRSYAADASTKPRTLRLVVAVSQDAGASFARSQRETQPRRLPVECGTQAFAAHEIDTAGENGDAWLWCVDEDVYLTLVFHGYNKDRWNGLELDEAMAVVGRAALSRVPTA